MDDSAAEPPPIDERLEEAERLIGTDALWRGQILYTGAELGLFGRLDADPTGASEIASELELDPERTYRLMRAMAHFGVLEETDGRRFALTPVGELLQVDHPHSVRSDLLFNRSPAWIRSMLHLPAVVSEGGPPGFVREFGEGFFDYAAANPEFARRYNDLMELASRDHPELVLDALDGYDLSRCSLVCDVGGGRGHFLCHLLAAVPDLEGVVLDRPSVLSENGPRWARELGVADRVTYVTGDMFEAVPEADCYLLKWILHNWDDEECLRILSTVHDAAPADGRLFVLETLVPGPSSSHPAKRLDVTMMAQVGGRERTKAEFSTLLEESGWRLEGTWEPEEGPLHILEAVKD